MQKLSQGLYPPLETQVVGILSERIEMNNSLKDHYDYVDTDSVKQILNAQYGKEVGMKDYIIVHREDTKSTGIIFKKSIDAILEREDETCLIVNGCSVYCEDKYKDIVMKILK